MRKPSHFDLSDFKTTFYTTRLQILGQKIDIFNIDSIVSGSSNMYQFYMKHHIEEQDFRILVSCSNPEILWLQSLTMDQKEISIGLDVFFDACTVNPKNTIDDTISFVMNQIKQSKLQISSLLFKRLLYRMLVSESNRLNRKEFTTWLLDVCFHKSLLCCALEITRFIYRVQGFKFRLNLRVICIFYKFLAFPCLIS